MTIVPALGLAALIAAAAHADDAPPFDPGPPLGTALPALELPDQTGKPRAFRDISGPEGLLLLVYRSADW